MALTQNQHKLIKELLVNKIRNKLSSYHPETSSMPFHYRLLGKNRMALFSFIHSVNTMLGQSIFEQVAKIIAQDYNLKAETQYQGLKGFISSGAMNKIDEIMRGIRDASIVSDSLKQSREIAKVASLGKLGKEIKKRIDLFIESKNHIEYFIEIKTAKPNIDVFVRTKQQMLEIVALRMSKNPKAKTQPIIAIPYNPYEPKPYERWTLQGLFDLKKEVLVGKEFWDFLGGRNTYEDLLKVFEDSGLLLYDEIDEKMKNL